MGNRFGRNQRRRARAELAEANRLLERERIISEGSSAIAAAYFDLLTELERRLRLALGEDTALTATIRKKVTKDRLADFPTFLKIRPMIASGALIELGEMTFEEQYDALLGLVMKVEDDPIKSQKLVRFIEVSHRTGESRYQISEQALAVIGFTSQDLRQFADDLVNLLFSGYLRTRSPAHPR